MIDKKGQVNTLAPAILALVFAGIVLIFGIIMSQELRDNASVNDVSVTVAHEESGYLNLTGYSLVADKFCGFNNPVITSAWNATNGSLIISTNYAVSAAGLLTNATSTNWLDVNLTYTYDWGDEACVGANATVVGLGTFADFWEIIVLAIVITVVIGLLLIIFGGAGRRR